MSSIEMGAPNYVNPPSIGWKVETADLVTIIAALIFVITRMYTKICLTRCTGWEDYTSIMALLVAIARTVSDYLNTQIFGLGLHFKDIHPSHYNGYLSSTFVNGLLYILIIMLVKISLLVFLYRIFGVDAKFRYTTWVVGTIVTIWSVVSILLAIFSCRPLGATFNLELRIDPKTVCYPESYIVILYYGLCNIITDFALLVMPMPMLWKMKMARAKKIGVACVFATGGFIFSISIYRQWVLFTDSQATDPSWQIIPTTIWMSVEANIAIVCGCLPVLTPLFRKIPLLAPFLPQSIRSKLTGHNVMEQHSWPKVLRGPRSDPEMGQVGQTDTAGAPRRAMWREPDSSSGSEENVHAMFHQYNLPSETSVAREDGAGLAF